MSKFFIEIGTADFNTCEDLALKGWKGIFVEPVKPLLDNIMRYDGCIYENCAILPWNGHTPFKYYNPDVTEGWRRGVGNARRSANHFNIPKYAKDIVEIDVKCMKLDTLIEKHDVKEIDFLKIDIEGWEYRILDNYSWIFKPKELKIEYEHWNIDHEPYVKLLESMDYEVKVGPRDLFAVLDDADGFHGKSYAEFKKETQ